jgi:hypothetical protein
MTLKVYNVLGEEVATLLEGARDAGHGMVEWDATGLSNGVYFLRLQAGHSSATERLVLLR